MVQNNDPFHLFWGLVSILVPVGLCTILVGLNVHFANLATRSANIPGIASVVTDYLKTNEALIPAISSTVTMFFLVVSTTLFVSLYYYKCYKIIQVYLIISTLFLLIGFPTFHLSILMRELDIILSMPTTMFIIINMGVVCMLAIHWKAPKRLQQESLILTSTSMALLVLYLLPHWSVWPTLFAMVAWDLFAVLAPCGPLRILVKTARYRDDTTFPALLYTTGAIFSSLNASSSPSTSRKRRKESREEESMMPVHAIAVQDQNESPRTQSTSCPSTSRSTRRDSFQYPPPLEMTIYNHEDMGVVRLGLGDFIFYSVLFGDTVMTSELCGIVSCFLGILAGLTGTLIYVALSGRLTPALPMSIMLSIGLVFCSKYTVTPFITEITDRGMVY